MELRIEKLCKAYDGVPVLQDLSFCAGIGITEIKAPSGTGKTTLLRILTGLETADSGSTGGCEAWRWGVVFQENRLLEQLDARGNLRFALGKDYEESAAEAMLEHLGLAEAAGKCVRTYSGGMKRRLALTRALLAKSDALALDEPFAGLDAENRQLATQVIAEAAKSRIVLLVSHENEALPTAAVQQLWL